MLYHKHPAYSLYMFFGVFLLCVIPSISMADDLERLLDLSIDELLDIKVTSVSRHEENLLTAPAAVYVISSSYLDRSGVKTIPDALRVVPGLHVASIDGNKWVVSSRGFSGRYANKLLVQVDGRSVYSPTYSGVNWDMLNLPISIIERIEVIRGPGASLWGANAVNGVINIITKKAGQGDTTRIEVAAGNQLQSHFNAFTTAQLGPDSALRFHIKQSEYNDNRLWKIDQPSDDQLKSSNAGFRLDHQTEYDSYTLQGELQENNSNQKLATLWLAPPAFLAQSVDDQFTAKGWNLLGRWQHFTEDGGESSLQIYWDHNERDELYLGREHKTFDVDFQYHFPKIGNHEVIFGMGYRFIETYYKNSFAVAIQPSEHNLENLSAFIQDEIVLYSDLLKLTIGSKFESNDISGGNVQPSVRLLWTPKDGHAFWGGISKAVRTPSLVESYGNVVTATLPSTSLLLGSENLDTEELIAYELGYRYYAKPGLYLDSTLFYNKYSQFSSFEYPSEDTIQLANNLSGYTYGAELSANWQVTNDWLLQANYSYLDINMGHSTGNPLTGIELAEGSSPKHTFQFISQLDLNDNWRFDAWLYAVDEIVASSSVALAQGQVIDEFISVNARLSWDINKNLSFSLNGHNLFDSHNIEYIGEFFSSPTEVERSVFAQLTWVQ